MSDIDAILELTTQVESLIAEGRWDEAARIEARRREQLVEYIDREGAGAPGLQELHARSTDALTRVVRQRSELAAKSGAVMSGARAVGAYLDNAAATTRRRP